MRATEPLYAAINDLDTWARDLRGELGMAPFSDVERRLAFASLLAGLTLSVRVGQSAFGPKALTMIYRVLADRWDPDFPPELGPRTVSPKMREAVIAKYGRACAMCEDASEPLHIDHIVPYSKGGPTVLANLQPLCASCNSWKAARL